MKQKDIYRFTESSLMTTNFCTLPAPKLFVKEAIGDMKITTGRISNK